MSELIYSNQFPDDDRPEIKPGQILNIFNYIPQKVYKELVFVPIPGREETEKIFFFNAVELANKYKSISEFFPPKAPQGLPLL